MIQNAIATMRPTIPHSLLQIDGLAKAYSGVPALTDAHMDVRAGEVHVLVGENGAGKSTLIKAVAGAIAPDSGTMLFDGQHVRFRTPIEAEAAGIVTIHQEFTLVPAMTVRDNLFLGHSRTQRGTIDTARETREGRAILDRLGAEIDLDTPVRQLSVSHQQMVEIGRALLRKARLLILDESTAALSPADVEKQFALLRDLREEGLAIVFISHRLDEIFSIGDRITVLRDGHTIGTWTAADLSPDRLIREMVGRSLEQEFPSRAVERGPVRLEVNELGGGFIQPATFTVHAGEVLGLFGLVGSGRTDLVRMIAGADRAAQGSVTLGGQRVNLASPRSAIRAGICLLTEDRKGQGLLLRRSCRENFAIGNLDRWSRLGWIDEREELQRFQDYVGKLSIRLASPDQLAGHLSGGNQQKLILARWLERNSRVVIVDEPTRGIDVGAKVEIYHLIHELTAHGVAVILISSELPELLGMADRILVMHEGRITGELANSPPATQEEVMALAVA